MYRENAGNALAGMSPVVLGPRSGDQLGNHKGTLGSAPPARGASPQGQKNYFFLPFFAAFFFLAGI